MDNHKITCGCGCGESIPAINKKGEPARFKHGHYARTLCIDPLCHYVEEDRGHETPCWIWQGGTSGEYGRASVNGTNRSAHRVFYEAHVGPIPSGLQLDHLCKVPRCVNPKHLEPVTGRENRRRASTLSPDDVRQIRAAYEAAKRPGRNARQGVIPALADRFGVSYRTVQRIGRREKWADL